MTPFGNVIYLIIQNIFLWCTLRISTSYIMSTILGMMYIHYVTRILMVYMCGCRGGSSGRFNYRLNGAC